MFDKYLKANFILTLSVIIIVTLIYFSLPNLEFKNPNANRIFGIFFNIVCIYFSILLLKCSLKYFNKALKYFLFSLSAIFFLTSIINLAVYLLKIDPQVQYYDVETLSYWNTKNKFEKLEKQYHVNWKNNMNDTVINNVSDFGPFRNFNEYDIQLKNLGKNWHEMKKNK